MSLEHFNVGQVYSRKRDIHLRFKGQQQGGISTPAGFPLVIAFTGSSGVQHGYADEWTAEGTFRYFGEGQVGDMKFKSGNKAIAEHAADGKDLLMFETLGKGKGVRFLGAFNCVAYAFEPAPDRLGNMRNAIVFELTPIGADGDLASPIPSTSDTVDLAELRRRAMAAAGPAQQSTASGAARQYFKRSDDVRRYVLARATGICESCDSPAPFTSLGGSPYLEPHHIRRLTDAGLDHPAFMGAVCPNCHREIHHGQHGRKRNQELQERISTKEGTA
jgi:5-methylcytosine-specific restriction enzyme A